MYGTAASIEAPGEPDARPGSPTPPVPGSAAAGSPRCGEALAISFIPGVIASARHTRIDAKSNSTGRRDVITEHAADHALAEDMHAPPTPLWGGQSGFAFAVVNEKKVQIASVADGPRGSV